MQRSWRELGQGNRKRIQKRRESLKGFPFSPNLVRECVSPPPLTLPWDCHTQTAQSSVTLIPPEIKRKRENKNERGGSGEEGERKGAFANTDVKLFHLNAAPHHYCPLHLPRDFKSCSNSSHTGCRIVVLTAMLQSQKLNILLVINCAKYSVSDTQST